MTQPLPQIVVIGGGIAGLAAAAFLSGAAGGPARAAVTLLEAGDRLGGKLLSGEVGGVRVDLGAESVLARRPEAVDLARDVGLADVLEPPTTAKAAVWSRDALRPLPAGQLMGVPGDLEALAASGVISAAGLRRAGHEEPIEVGEDIAIGAYIEARLGREVLDRLVEPLLGGVYAGHADQLSLRAAIPALLPIAQRGGSLVDGVRELVSRSTATGPVFQGLRGGIGTLPPALAAACARAGAELRTRAAVQELRRTPEGWQVVTATGTLTPDAVLLAVPAPVAARLLADSAPGAAAELAGVDYASMALVTLAFRRADLPEPPSGSGFLVPPVDGRAIKAATFSSNKWGWLERSAPDSFLLRTSLGRFREEQALQLPDEELVARSLADLREAVGLRATPYDSAVTRWTDGLPQYPVGHPAKVARIRAQAARVGGLALAGAAYDGVGIAACVASARRAVNDLLTPLAGAADPEGRMSA
ncbi:oxygen-dependent protoporphyrinogen oxidase [Kitasatospora sp. MAP12-15]|uniref:protoporphyrinogen oxidase n=1 Tax=unclassified Kitasatospora TaxID=2633591 RepID=UPI002476B311|nr:protoporphyrinogen oxidase [Kitasatospora sp. MAP12-44]MDH6113288.1 oxygen-dependent protoporphyrinogen oxidase [Kitasatospora sp. MAP12-44]